MVIPKIFKNTAIYSIIMILQKGINFLLIPLYTLYLTPDEYGILAITSSISSLLSIFVTLGFDTGAQRLFYKYNDDLNYQKRLYGTGILSIVVSSLVFGAIFFIFKDYIVKPLIGNIPFYPYIFLSLLNTIITPLYYFYQSYLQTKQDGIHYAKNSMAFFIIQVILIIIFLVVFELGVIGILLANLLVSLVFLIYIIPNFILKQNICLDKKILKESFQYTLPLMPHTIANWSNGALDKIFINGLRSESETGIYNLGQQYGSVLGIMANAINQAYVPWFFEKVNDKQEGLNSIKAISEISVSLICIVGLVMSMFSKEILTIMIVNPAYLEVWKIIPWVLGAYMFQCIFFFFVNVLYLNDTKVIFTITLASIIINIVMNIILIPKLGYTGSAIAFFFTFFTKSLMALILSRLRNSQISFNWLKLYSLSFISISISLVLMFLETKYNGLLMIKFLCVSFVSLIYIFLNKSSIKTIYSSITHLRIKSGE